MVENKFTDSDFDKLFEKYYPGLLFYASQFLDEEGAKDVVQDVFMELWRKKDILIVGDKIQSYLYRLIYTHAINVLKHKKVEAKYSDVAIELYKHKIKFFESEADNEVIRKLEDQELLQAIDSAMDKLPDKCGEVFKLSYLHDLKNKEIAEALNISLRTVEAHIYKALKILRNELKHLQSSFLKVF